VNSTENLTNTMVALAKLADLDWSVTHVPPNKKWEIHFQDRSDISNFRLKKLAELGALMDGGSLMIRGRN
jgi:hypothetical protein